MKIFIDCLILLPIIGISNAQAQEIDSFLFVKDSIYTVEYKFTTICPEDKLLEIFYDFSHLMKFARTKNTTIKQLEKGENWHNVQYDYHYFIYKSSAIYKKTIIPKDTLVKFELINYSHNIGIIPKVLAAFGYYKITHENEENLVTYYQETILEGPMQWFHLNLVKSQTKEFLTNLKDYVKKFEDRND